MNTTMMQEMVAEKIQLLYQISQDLETLFPGRHYTPDVISRAALYSGRTHDRQHWGSPGG